MHLKVNDLAFARGIEWLLPNLSSYGRVMVDLKLHEIPNTVKNVCRHLARYAPWAVTVHASGGLEMITEARLALDGVKTKILAVTVLTSIDPETCEEIYHRRPKFQVMQLAKLAWTAGAHGFVCAPEETKILIEAFPQALIVNPGVRSVGAEAGDQQRLGTPRSAIDAGAYRIVMGRQLSEAADPVGETRRVLVEELGLTHFA